MLLHQAFVAALLSEPQKASDQQPIADFVANGGALPPQGQRASSPLRKHKRKAAVPHRSAVDVGAEEAPAAVEHESRPKERRGSTSPDPPFLPAQQARHGRPQRAAAQHPPPLPEAAPAPEQLAAAFEQPAAPPAWAAAAPAAATVPGAPKVCAQCGTSTTPMWRTVGGLTYCNADGLRLKRKLGLL